MFFFKLSKLRNILVGVVVLIGLLSAPSVLASTYGSGSYGSCQYGQGCPANNSGGSSSAAGNAPAASQPAGQIILLNDFSEYFTEVGKQLELQANQVVYFDITVGQTTERHSATIKEVGSDYVIITLASNSVDVKLFVGDVRQFDVTGDSQADIQITLASINAGKATLIFKNLSAASTSAAKASPSAQTSTKSKWSWLIYSALLVVGLFIFLLLFFKRRKTRTQNQA